MHPTRPQGFLRHARPSSRMPELTCFAANCHWPCTGGIGSSLLVDATMSTAPLVALLSGVVLSFSPLVFRLATCSDWQYLLFRLLGVCFVATVGLVHSHSCRVRMFVLLLQRKTILAGALMACANCAFILALARIDSATSILMQGFAPVVAALLGRMLPPREHLDGNAVISILLSLGGLALMTTTWAADDPLGLLAAGVIPLALGAYAVVLRRMEKEERDTWAPLLWAGVFGTFVGLVACAASPSGFAISARDVLLALSAGCLVLGVGLAIFNIAAYAFAPSRLRLSPFLPSAAVAHPHGPMISPWQAAPLASTCEPADQLGNTARARVDVGLHGRGARVADLPWWHTCPPRPRVARHASAAHVATVAAQGGDAPNTACGGSRSSSQGTSTSRR